MKFSLFVFLLILILLIPGVSPSVYGGDSGDVILASWFAGVAHPPGYPLNTMFGWFFAHLPFDWTIAYKVNLAAAFLQASGALLVFLISKKLTGNIIPSVITALLLAFNPLYWLYAHTYEVFQLNTLLLGLATYFLISWWQEFRTKKNFKKLYLFSLFWGLAVFHHHTSILLAPAFGYLILKTNRRAFFTNFVFIKTGLFFLLGFLPYIFILFAAMRQTPVNWDDPRTLNNFVRLIFRLDYGTFTAANFLVGSTLYQKILQIINYLLFLKADFSSVGVLLIGAGAIYTFLKQRVIFWFLFLSVIIPGPFFLVYAGFPIATDFYTGLWERFLLISYYYIALFLGFGVKLLLDSFAPLLLKNLRFSSFNYRKLIFSLCLLAYPFAMFLVNFPKANLANFTLGDSLAFDILKSAQPNSILLLIGDTALFNSQYLYYTQKPGDNKRVIRAGSLAFIEYRHQVAREYKELEYPDSFFSTQKANYVGILIEANKDKFPIYIRDFYPEPAEGYKWMSVGLLKKLVKDEDFKLDDLKMANEKLYPNFKGIIGSTGYSHYITNHLEEHYYNSLIDLAMELLYFKDEQNSLFYSRIAQKLLPQKKEAYIMMGNTYNFTKECRLAEENFTKVVEIDKRDWQAYDALAEIYAGCYGDTQKSQELKNKSRAIKPGSEDTDLKKF